VSKARRGCVYNCYKNYFLSKKKYIKKIYFQHIKIIKKHKTIKIKNKKHHQTTQTNSSENSSVESAILLGPEKTKTNNRSRRFDDSLILELVWDKNKKNPIFFYLRNRICIKRPRS
jgi:hypothetical protein